MGKGRGAAGGRGACRVEEGLLLVDAGEGEWAQMA